MDQPTQRPCTNCGTFKPLPELYRFATDILLAPGMPAAEISVLTCSEPCAEELVKKVAKLKVASEKIGDLMKTNDMTRSEMLAHQERMPPAILHAIIGVMLLFSAHQITVGAALWRVAPALAVTSFMTAAPLLFALPAAFAHLKRKQAKGDAEKDDQV